MPSRHLSPSEVLRSRLDHPVIDGGTAVEAEAARVLQDGSGG